MYPNNIMARLQKHSQVNEKLPASIARYELSGK